MVVLDYFKPFVSRGDNSVFLSIKLNTNPILWFYRIFTYENIFL